MVKSCVNCFMLEILKLFLIFSVIGALIGKQKSRNIEIMNSFELVFNVIGGDIVIDRDYYNTKEEQCKFYLALSIAV